MEQLSFETRLKRDELDCFGVGGLFCVKGESYHAGLSDGEVGARTPLTLTYSLLHFGAASHSMRPLRKRSQWENPKASVDVSARTSQFARKCIFGDEEIGMIPLELPSQVFQTVAIRSGPPPTSAAGPPGILSGALAAIEYTGESVRRNSNGDGGTGGRSIWIQVDNVQADRQTVVPPRP